MERLYHPDSLLCFCTPLLALSTLLIICLLLISEPLHVPAHAFVQAGVDPRQVRHRLTVAKCGQPQVAELTLADAEGRHTGNANGKVERVRW